MTVRIKNWSRFQHFKERHPPWVKLYRDLLDDIEWHELEPRAAKALVTLWLIASESDGELPDTKKLSFRMRIPEKEVLGAISKLHHWLDHDDIEVISGEHTTRCQDDIALKALARSVSVSPSVSASVSICNSSSEKRAREGFEEFWEAYPKRRSRGQAEKAWDKLSPDPDTVKAILYAVGLAKTMDTWQREEGRFIPYPATWLNAKGWLDDPAVTVETLDWWLKSGFGSKREAIEAGVKEPA